MRLVTMEPATLLVRANGRTPEALCIPATGFLCGGHVADHIQRCLLSLGPTTPEHHRTRGGARALGLLARDQGARRAPRPQGIEAERLALPRCHGTQGRAACLAPARLLPRGLQGRPVTRAVAKTDHRGPRREPRAPHRDHRDVQGVGTVARRRLAHPPGQQQGAPWGDDMAPARGTAAAHAPALQDEPHRLQGQRTPPDVRRGQTVHLLHATRSVAPSGHAFEPALGPGASRDVGGDAGPWGALPAHDPPEERCQGAQVPGDAAGGLARIPWASSVRYGTRSAQGARLVGSLWIGRACQHAYTMRQPLMTYCKAT